MSTEHKSPFSYVDDEGTKFWLKNGSYHREDGPAVEWSNGGKLWYLDGKLHREDGPAIERGSGTKHWYLNGSLHRENGPATEWSNGEKEWYINGQRHRTCGPAIETCEIKEWFLDGKYLGQDDKGFWALWDLLTDEERNSTDLLFYLPGAR